MQLISRKNSFEITILSYEFPYSKDKYDANWLRVLMRATNGEKSWEAIDSCLRTFELVELKNWFESISLGVSCNRNFNFTESELSFSLDNKEEVHVMLDFAFHPSGNRYDYDTDREFILNFKLDEIDFQKILDSLTKAISAFPSR